MENSKEKSDPAPSKNLLEISNDASEPETSSPTTNNCIACTTNKRAVVFVPCAHYIACVSCGHGMAVCPKCRSKIDACVRIYE